MLYCLLSVLHLYILHLELEKDPKFLKKFGGIYLLSFSVIWFGYFVCEVLTRFNLL